VAAPWPPDRRARALAARVLACAGPGGGPLLVLAGLPVVDGVYLGALQAGALGHRPGGRLRAGGLRRRRPPDGRLRAAGPE
jgi:hypothetical protein